MTRGTSSIQWTAGTAVVCVLALVASWLLLLGPMLDAAAVTRDQAAQVHIQNEALRRQVEALRAEYGNVDAYRSELAGLRQQLPQEVQLTGLTREVDAAADATGVTVVALGLDAAIGLSVRQTGDGAPVAAQPLDPSAGTAPVDPAQADLARADPAQADPAQATAATGGTPAAAPAEGMLAIPVSVSVTGSVEAVRAFLDRLQTGLQRQLLVTALSVAALEESAGDDRRPASAAGDIRATVGAYAYVLPVDAAAVDLRSSTQTALPTSPRAGAFTAPAAAGADDTAPSGSEPATAEPDQALAASPAPAASPDPAAPTAPAATAEAPVAPAADATAVTGGAPLTAAPNAPSLGASGG